MITKERLEELHKQGATIIRVTGQGLSRTISKFYLDPSCEYYFDDYDLSIVYETEEHYKWQQKILAERTERFEPPMWEDIQNEYSFKFVVDQILYKFIVTKNNNAIGIYNATTEPDLFTAPATKENYEKVCEMVRDLFKGKQQ